MKNSLHYVYFSYFFLDQDLNPGFTTCSLGKVRLQVPTYEREQAMDLVKSCTPQALEVVAI